MDVLFLTQTYPRFAGDTAGPFIRDLARAMVAAGDRVTVLVPHAQGVRARWQEDGVETLSFRYAPTSLEVLGYSRSLSSDETVRWRAGLVTPLYARAARRALQRLVAQRRFDLVHGHWVVPNGWIAASASLPLPVAIGLHGSDVFLAEKPGIRRLVARALRGIRLVTGCSPELVDRVCALGFDRDRARVIPYGVDSDQFAPDPRRRMIWRERLGIPESAILVLGVGRMVTKKGFHVLLDEVPALLERCGQVHFLLAGEGDRLEEFRRRAADRTERVHFPGIVLRDDLVDLYRAADLFVLPAVHDRQGNVDGLPNVILEAMASGLPVVSSAISGIPLAIRDGVEGRLVAEGDRDGLVKALAELLTDTRKRHEMGRAARRRAETELTWRAVAARYREAYEQALASAR